MNLNVQKLPVFVFPTVLKFYLNSRQSHKQLLTLYNPYEFPVRFKVLCTSPNKYTVIDPEGSIGPLKCVDIVIRHTMPSLSHCNVIDKFRITMQDHTTKQVLGKRDIEAKLLQTEPDTNSNDGDNFHSLTQADKDSDEQQSIQYPVRNFQRSIISSNSTNFTAIVAGLVCIFALLLPTKEEKQEITQLPPYLHLSMNLKLVFAYVLGLVSMVVLRP